MKNQIIVTGGAGFIGSNLIKKLIKFKKFLIISIDDYSSGSKKNHIKSPNLKYIHGHTKDISKILKKRKKNIQCIFHFGEFARIFKSFANINKCFSSNIVGTSQIFKFCLENKIKLIYSATSATLGNAGKDEQLSPYAFTKAKNLELLENLNKWYGFSYEVIYFYNVYGPGQIKTGSMATVIGIFEHQFKNKLPLTIVRPGTQKRKFTHVEDTIEVCIDAWRKNKCKHYSISSKKNYSINQIATMFGGKIKYLPARLGERYNSSVKNYNLNRKIINKFSKINIKDYINDYKKNYK